MDNWVNPTGVTGALMTHIGNQVALLRAAAELSQDDLAERSGVHRNTINKLERHVAPTIQLDKLEALAKALGVTVDDLIVMDIPTDEETEQSLRAFLATPLGADVSDAEKAALRKHRWTGKPTNKSWFYLLEADRASRGEK